LPYCFLRGVVALSVCKRARVTVLPSRSAHLLRCVYAVRIRESNPDMLLELFKVIV
jgi:hypothetical protein